jgi:hypothetical protein
MRPLPPLMAVLALAACAVGLSCRAPQVTSNAPSAPPVDPSDIRPNRIAYVDTDAFDTVFEAALIYQDPLIVVQTQEERPEWGPRLNAWIAAWNASNREGPRRPVLATRARGQIPTSPVVVNGESIREFRLLVDDLLGRVETVAKGRSTWWAEERLRQRRVTLLKPYNLRFHLDADGHIQLIFFHGQYAASYPMVMQRLDPMMEGEGARWDRAVTCSRSKPARE